MSKVTQRCRTGDREGLAKWWPMTEDGQARLEPEETRRALTHFFIFWTTIRISHAMAVIGYHAFVNPVIELTSFCEDYSLAGAGAVSLTQQSFT